MNNTSQKDELKDPKAVDAKGTTNETEKTRQAEIAKTEGENKTE